MEYSGKTGAAKFRLAWHPNIRESLSIQMVISFSVRAKAFAFRSSQSSPSVS